MIQVAHVSKKYKMYRKPSDRLKEWLTFSSRTYHTEFWALKDISFDLETGGACGIIGPNGAGKSTLLKTIVGVTEPTAGTVHTQGRIAALLELGAGFYHEFTGRQNIFLNAKILGLSESEIQEKLGDIMAFSELGAFIDQPVRTYSSGMYVRLGFAIAANVDPEVLIIDESLAVGDAYFQAKCIQRLREFRARGITILFVSHDLAAVKTFCDEVILLDQGTVVERGKPAEVLDYYNALVAKRTARQEFFAIEKQFVAQQNTSAPAALRSGSFDALIRRIELLDQQGYPARTFLSGEPGTIEIDIAFLEEIQEPTVGILIRDRLGNDVYGINTYTLGVATGDWKPGDVLRMRYRLTMQLGAGNYTVTAAVHSLDVHLYECYDWADKLLAFKVMLPPNVAFIGVARLDATVECTDRQVKTGDPQAILASVFAEAPDALEMNSAFAKYLLKGWHEVQEGAGCAVRWTRQEFSFILQKQHANYLCFKLCSFMPSLQAEPIRALVLTAGRRLGTFLVDCTDFREIRIAILAHELSCIIKFTVRLNKVWIPQQNGESTDDRGLGVLVQKIWLE
jgi:lipopolysaccharide transport system ATP-binding protein